MKRLHITLLLALLTPFPAVSEIFGLGPWIDRQFPWSDSAMITWTSPVNGYVNIFGNAWVTNHSSSVWLEYIPEAYASNLNPGNVLQSGTIPVANGTVQAGTGCAGPVDLGTEPCIPLRTPPLTLNNLPVQKGDVLAALIQNFYLPGGDTVGLNLAVQVAGDFQQPGGSLSNPQAVTGTYTGISGSLSNGSSEAYQFYWSGSGDFSGTATTNSIFQNGVGAGGFPNGIELSLFSSPSNDFLASSILLGASTTSGTFDFGSLPAGNYVVELTDKSSGLDPSYNIEFNGSIDTPSQVTPEPGGWLMIGTGLLGLYLARRRRSKLRFTFKD